MRAFGNHNVAVTSFITAWPHMGKWLHQQEEYIASTSNARLILMVLVQIGYMKPHFGSNGGHVRHTTSARVAATLAISMGIASGARL